MRAISRTSPQKFAQFLHKWYNKRKDSIVNPFQEFVQAIPETHKESKKWSLTSLGMFDNGHPIDFDEYLPMFRVIAKYFREWQKMANLEAQVLIVTNDDYVQHYGQFPILPYDGDLKIVILPQYNTSANTIVDDTYWYQTVKSVPIMRIHSHHILDAYQSKTDYDGLNSGTLEVVFGHVDTDVIDVAYWLTQFSDPAVKGSVFKTKFSL